MLSLSQNSQGGDRQRLRISLPNNFSHSDDDIKLKHEDLDVLTDEVYTDEMWWQAKKQP